MTKLENKEMVSLIALTLVIITVAILLSLLFWKLGIQTIPPDTIPFFYGIN